MKNNLWVISLLLGIFVLGLVSCSDDNNEAPASTTTLTEGQAQDVAAQISQALQPLLDNALGASPRLAVRAQSSNAEFSASANCEGSGSVDLVGTSSVSVNSDVASGSFDVMQTFNDCESEETSNSFALNGTLTTTGNINIDRNDFTGSASVNAVGSIEVSGDGVDNGTCGIDLETTADFGGGGALTLTYDASICGVDIDFNETVDIE